MVEHQAIFSAKNLQAGDQVGTFTLMSHFDKGSGKKHRYWVCRCNECDHERPIRTDHLKRFVGKGCICSSFLVFHGQSQVREFKIWKHMLARCYNTRNDNYRFYGGIGRYVCQRFRESYDAFMADVGKSPSLKHTLDRIDSNGSYTCGKCDECRDRNQPANVRWATKQVQVRNAKNNIWFTHNGETLILKDWARRFGINYLKLYHRLFRDKVPFEEAISELRKS
jgi:hypothetical protein